MTRLEVYRHDDPDHLLASSEDTGEIAARLGEVGIRFERWTAARAVAPTDSPADVLETYRADLDRLVAAGGYQKVDVVRMAPDHPDREALRKKFLFEHRHTEDEVRVFVAGAGLFSLHLGDTVYEVLCCQGDLISVPANTPHWFDMGPRPSFVAIRLFTDPKGWVAHGTGSDLADRFHRYEGG